MVKVSKEQQARFWGWVIDPLKQTIAASPVGVLVDALKEQQKWIYEVGIWTVVHGCPRRSDPDKTHLIQAVRMATGDHMFVSEDGWHHDGLGLFNLEGYPYPLAGRAMVVSAQRGFEDWTYGAPNVSLELLREWVHFTDTCTTGKIMPGGDLTREQMARLLPNIPPEMFEQLKMRGISAGHPIPRALNAAMHIFEERDGA